MGLNFYPHTAKFIIPGAETVVDYIPVVGDDVELDLICNVQPTSSTISQGEDSQTTTTKFKCFLRPDQWDDKLKNAKKVEFEGTWEVLNVRYKQKFGHEFLLGVVS